MTRRSLASLIALTACWLASGLRADDVPAPGLGQLGRLDLLPQLKTSIVVGSVSSYDRTGGNDDGFSGKYSFVRKEEGGLVIADLQGPGIIYRFTTPTPSDDLVEFYFDGETAPRIRVQFREMFTGAQPPFEAPLVGYGAGGFYSYVPLPFKKSCKVLVRGERVQFYQLNYARYADDAPIATWTSTPSSEEMQQRERALALFGSTGRDLASQAAPPDATLTVHSQQVSLRPGTAATLLDAQSGGRIVGLRLAPAAALAGKDRDIVLRITWDGAEQPAVLCPAGDFFGYAWGRPAARSLLVGTDADVNYCYFPMPFDKSAKVELVSDRPDGPPVELHADVITADVPRRENEGRFCAVWRRENPTTKGQPFTFVAAQGQGHVVGCLLQAQGMVPGETPFFEGDDETTLDGETTIRGTGSEDFFNGGWYDVPDRWERNFSFPLSGCLDYQKPLGRSGGYRLMLGDALAFRQSVLQTIEHAPEKNAIAADYVGVTYLYLATAPSWDSALPAVAERRVVDPTRVVFKPAWAVPIRAFTFRNATLTKLDEELNGTRVGFLRMQAAENDWFGAPFIALECPLPAAGKYRISIEAIEGPAQAVVQLFRNEMPAGPAVDFFAEKRAARSLASLGTIDALEGSNTLMLKLVRKHEKSSGFGLDLATIVCERAD
jgi:hypothetical protein